MSRPRCNVLNGDGSIPAPSCWLPVGHWGPHEPGPGDRVAPECDCLIPYLEGAGQHSPGCACVQPHPWSKEASDAR